jgi:hypothetical protein
MTLRAALSVLLDRMENSALTLAHVIPWAAPVPAFGDPAQARVATVGLNPSNREFVSADGQELHGHSRRFQTLSSLGLARWSEANAIHIDLIEKSCRTYFSTNPYDAWFRSLDRILSGVGISYYSGATACHLDLIPFATASKWTLLNALQRSALLSFAGETLGLLIRDSLVEVVVLNGSSVVKKFQEISGARLDETRMREWSLSRRQQSALSGFAYSGKVRQILGIPLGRKILVLGYNHNLQSSFGITTEVRAAIGEWIAREAREALV